MPSQTNIDTNSVIKKATLLVVGIFIIGVLLSSIVLVDAGDRGVLLTWGKVEDKILQPGLNFIMPIAQSVVHTDVRTQKVEHDASAASADLQTVSTKVALNFHLDSEKVNAVYIRLGNNYGDTVIAPAIQEAVKASTAKFTAEELITKRDVVKETINQELSNRLRVYNIITESILITNFDFSPQFNAQIEAKVTAEQRALTELNNLKMVEYVAQQKVAQAVGEANATLTKAQAEAQAIYMTAQALKENPQLVQLEIVKRWDGVLPNFVMGGASAIPLLDLSKITGATP
jgi:regulator of protease activity HflC (stomatin/prohibitin superfamily)